MANYSPRLTMRRYLNLILILLPVISMAQAIDLQRFAPPQKNADKYLSGEIADSVVSSGSWYVKTNIPVWGMLWVNAAAEIDFRDTRWSAQLPIYWSGWDYFISTRKYRVLALQPELRFWFGKGSRNGFFAGIHLGIAWYNLAFNGEIRYQDHSRRTPAIGGGFAVGYRFALSRDRKWSMEASMGAGAYYLDYDIFHNDAGGRLTGRCQRTFFGIDHAAVSIVYSIGGVRTSRKGGNYANP